QRVEGDRGEGVGRHAVPEPGRDGRDHGDPGGEHADGVAELAAGGFAVHGTPRGDVAPMLVLECLPGGWRWRWGGGWRPSRSAASWPRRPGTRRARTRWGGWPRARRPRG